MTNETPPAHVRPPFVPAATLGELQATRDVLPNAGCELRCSRQRQARQQYLHVSTTRPETEEAVLEMKNTEDILVRTWRAECSAITTKLAPPPPPCNACPNIWTGALSIKPNSEAQRTCSMRVCARKQLQPNGC